MRNPKRDSNGDTIHIDQVSGLMRVNGCPVCRIEARGDTIWLEFRDSDKIRSQIRGTRFIAVPLPKFVNKVKQST